MFLSNKRSLYMLTAYSLAWFTLASAQKGQQQSIQSNSLASKPAASSSHSSTAYSNFTRPLDRPNLPYKNSNGSFSHLEPVADWLMLGAADDMSMLESKGALAMHSDGSISRNSTRRSTEKRKAHHKASNRTAQFDDEQSESTDSNEVFDDAEDNSVLAGTQKEPDCASHGRYYCTYKEEYPLKLVTEVTKYYKWPLEKLFRDLHAQIMPKLAQDSNGNLVCDSITRVVRPGWARNTNDRWLVVINTENYHQYVTEVVCQYGSNSRCNFIPPCYYSSCQQRYNTQKLLVIDPTNPYRGPFLSEFLFPSCCVCYVPSASESIQDKYRPSPATIYQRTMQQESSNNVYPPQFRPGGLLDPDSNNGQVLNQEPQQSAPQSTRVTSSASNSNQATSGTKQPAGPGEIRRGGDLYRRFPAEGGIDQTGRRTSNVDPSTGFSDFPRLGLSDSLISQQSVRTPGNLDERQ